MSDATHHDPDHGPVHGHVPGDGHVSGGGVEPDVHKVGMLVGWGIGMFVGVIACIVVLTGYFWWERDNEDIAKVHEVSLVSEQLREVRLREDAHLTKTEPVGGGAYRIPIQQAIELVVRDGL